MHGKNKQSAFTILSFATAFIFSVFLFWSSFSSYFFQDDWFSLSISHVRNIGDFLSFFKARPDLIYYRPLGMQLPFFLSQALFGLSPLPFRIATFLIHFFNGVIVYALLFEITKKRYWATFGSFLFLTSATHFTIFFWAATIAFIAAPTFFFGSFYLYIKRNRGLALLVFFLGLLVNELLITLPAILLLWEIFIQKRKIKKVLPFFILLLFYGLFRVTLARIPTTQSYALAFNVQQLVFNMRDYLLWIFNWPEEIHNQFIQFFILNKVFIREFFPSIMSFLLTTIFAIVVFGLLPLVVVIWSKKVTFAKNFFIFGILWFFITVGPVLFFSHHVFSYYLPIPMMGFLIAAFPLWNVFESRFSQKSFIPSILLGFFVIFWSISSYANTRFNLLIHWAPRRAVIAKDLVNNLQKNYEKVPQGASIVVSESDENIWALGNQHALKVIFDDPTIITIYE